MKSIFDANEHEQKWSRHDDKNRSSVSKRTWDSENASRWRLNASRFKERQHWSQKIVQSLRAARFRSMRVFFERRSRAINFESCENALVSCVEDRVYEVWKIDEYLKHENDSLSIYAQSILVNSYCQFVTSYSLFWFHRGRAFQTKAQCLKKIVKLRRRENEMRRRKNVKKILERLYALYDFFACVLHLWWFMIDRAFQWAISLRTW